MPRGKGAWLEQADPHRPNRIVSYIPHDSQDGLPSGVIYLDEIASRPDDFKMVQFNGFYVWKEIRPKKYPA